jgi:hypothetical protein
MDEFAKLAKARGMCSIPNELALDKNLASVVYYGYENSSKTDYLDRQDICD